MDRREFLKWSGIGSLAFVAPRSLLAESDPIIANDMMYDPTSADGFMTPLAVPGRRGLFGIVDVDRALPLCASAGAAALFPNNPEESRGPIVGYVTHQERKRYVNPTLRVWRGQPLHVQLVNRLPQPTIIHWHGLIIDGRNDGVPQQAIAPGGDYDYAFTVRNRAGTYWYHPHPYRYTSEQAFLGLAGYFIVEDEDDRRLRHALGLQLGVNEIPLVIQDKRFDDQNGLLYAPNESDWFMGYLGDRVLVNATLKPRLEVQRQMYRFRLLNGSNARIYRLAFVGATSTLPFHIIGNDGGFLPVPETVSDAFLAPGERLDVLVDLSGLDDREQVFLKSLAFDAMDNEAMGGDSADSPHMMMPMVPNGSELYLLALEVSGARRHRHLPPRLSRVDPIDTRRAAAVRMVALTADMVETSAGMKMAWLINGDRFDPAAFPIEVARNSVEVWEIRNDMASMPHPMHIHGFQFQVLERWGSPAQALGDGPRGLLPTDAGWKDTVLTWPGETVRIAIDFSTPFQGTQEYVVHCHNLEHEDEGMMINYRVI